MKRTNKQGGLCIREFENFNSAMMAKQGCRFLQNSNSLADKVLRAKYFPTTNFLKKKLGSNPSYFWQSILFARPLLEDGLLWRIGNGETVSIWTNKWLPSHNTFKSQNSIRFLQANTKVCNYIYSNFRHPPVEGLFAQCHFL